MSCPHTGLPGVMCAHCRGLQPLVKDPFTPRRVDEKLGQSTGVVGDASIARGYTYATPRSAWALEQILRSADEARRRG